MCWSTTSWKPYLCNWRTQELLLAKCVNWKGRNWLYITRLAVNTYKVHLQVSKAFSIQIHSMPTYFHQTTGTLLTQVIIYVVVISIKLSIRSCCAWLITSRVLLPIQHLWVVLLNSCGDSQVTDESSVSACQVGTKQDWISYHTLSVCAQPPKKEKLYETWTQPLVPTKSLHVVI